MKKILGLDLGTNSIGWALVENDFETKKGSILGIGTRIIPMSQDVIGDFGKGNSISQTAERTRLRSVRRLNERYLLRRQRLHRVLNVLGFLPEHFKNEIDFEKRLGQFKSDNEPKLAYNTNKFIFMDSFQEMLADFAKTQPELISGDKKVPYDWTIYYLRKKALTQKITKEELAWVLLNFNQKRGYYQLRGEDADENVNKRVEFYSLQVVDVLVDEAQRSKTDLWYSVVLENGWVYRRQSKTPLNDWKGKVKDFIVTTDLNEDGSEKADKEGKVKRSFRAPSEDDWGLIKKKTEAELESSNKTVGEYIFDNLVINPNIKIKGKLIRTIERKYYKDELKSIMTTQSQFHPELKSEQLYSDCVRELYRNNESHQVLLSKADFLHLFLNDIIFYQRPLRSQKSLISNCPLECRSFKDEKGNIQRKNIKVVPKSNPYFQEFRLWQWIKNLVIYRKDDDANVTADLIKDFKSIEALFEFVNNKKELKQDVIIGFLLELNGYKGKELKSEKDKYRWNYVEDKVYPGNETRYLITSKLSKVLNASEEALTSEIQYNLWHLIYSVTDKIEFEKALKSFAIKYEFDVESFVEAFKKVPPFKSEYGAFSEKAIKKLLPLMRLGKYWSWDNVDSVSKDRIGKILTGEYDENIKDRVRKLALHLSTETDFQGLPLWLAQYIVYDRHSEAEVAGKWNSSQEIENYLKEFKQHTLRNPIVEQVVLETLRVVKDIWDKYGNGQANFFNEIHIELGRDMKNSADKRKTMTRKITENENTNLRIKAMLAEMALYTEVENVRPYSPMQQEILKIYEEGVLNAESDIDEDILKISKTAQPSASELRRYKLWLEQRYRSPYTGAIIPLNRLFTSDYEIEHIVPQSRYFDDSQSNKVICESAVNKLKDNQFGFEFIKNHSGEIVELGFGKQVKVFTQDEYEAFVKRNYADNRSKRNKLLLEDIPEEMIERQLNDTRYISKFISSVLSNIVRAENNDEGVNSKNLLPGNGKITTELKQDWGLNDVWNDLILPRFERLNHLTNSTNFTVWNEKHRKFLPTVPLEYSKGFSKKRIDHRHHAMDALVIALASRDHINLLNNRSANSNERYDLNRKLRMLKKVQYTHPKTKETVERTVPQEFLKPWPNFTTDAKQALESIVVSFKQNLRIINKAVNKYDKWVVKNGVKVKEKVAQEGMNWAIRKPIHKDTVSGLVKLRKMKEVSLSTALDAVNDIVNREFRREIKKLLDSGKDKKAIVQHFKALDLTWNGLNISKVGVYYWDESLAASRVALDDTFDEARIKETITDTAIQKILLNHLGKYKGRMDDKGKEIDAHTLAFTPEGIDEMNKNIVELNNGNPHRPIYKVRTYEPIGNKFQVGQKGNKPMKFVEAAKGTNLYFAIYADEKGKRNYETIPLNVVIERLKQGLGPVPEISDKGDNLLFYLCPNDLVLLPNSDGNNNDYQIKDVYRFVSCTENEGHFVPATYAAPIVKNEIGSNNKSQNALNGKDQIKQFCKKMTMNRMGEIE